MLKVTLGNYQFINEGIIGIEVNNSILSFVANLSLTLYVKKFDAELLKQRSIKVEYNGEELFDGFIDSFRGESNESGLNYYLEARNLGELEDSDLSYISSSSSFRSVLKNQLGKFNPIDLNFSIPDFNIKNSTYLDKNFHYFLGEIGRQNDFLYYSDGLRNLFITNKEHSFSQNFFKNDLNIQSISFANSYDDYYSSYEVLGDNISFIKKFPRDPKRTKILSNCELNSRKECEVYLNNFVRRTSIKQSNISIKTPHILFDKKNKYQLNHIYNIVFDKFNLNENCLLTNYKLYKDFEKEYGILTFLNNNV